MTTSRSINTGQSVLLEFVSCLKNPRYWTILIQKCRSPKTSLVIIRLSHITRVSLSTRLLSTRHPRIPRHSHTYRVENLQWLVTSTWKLGSELHISVQVTVAAKNLAAAAARLLRPKEPSKRSPRLESCSMILEHL